MFSLSKQESPPAWTQEAYRPPCSKYSICCPNWVPPLAGYPPPGYPLSWPGWGGTWPGYPPAGYPLPGYLPARVPPLAGPGRVPPPVVAPWHSGKCCKALWDMGTPPRCGETNKVKLLPSHRTTYAGGNNLCLLYIRNHVQPFCSFSSIHSLLTLSLLTSLHIFQMQNS